MNGFDPCKKCGKFSGWYYGYCLDCWGNLSAERQEVIRLRAETYRELRRFKKRESSIYHH